MDHMSSELYTIVFSHLCQPSTIYIHILMNLGKGHLCDVVLANMSALFFCVLGTGIGKTCHVDLHSDPRPTLRCSLYLSTMLCSSLIFHERFNSKLLFDKTRVWRVWHEIINVNLQADRTLCKVDTYWCSPSSNHFLVWLKCISEGKGILKASTC